MTPRAESTFINEARRRQIVAATVRVLAEHGLSGTSLSRIAKTAGLSSAGLITYHFADKDDVFVTLTGELLADMSVLLDDRLAAAGDDPVERFEAYIRTHVGWQQQHPDEVSALWRLAMGWKAPGRDCAFDEAPMIDPLRSILSEGQEAGVFGDFDLDTVTALVAASVESYADRVESYGDDFAEQLLALLLPGLLSPASGPTGSPGRS